MGISSYLIEKLVKHFTNIATYSTPSTLYLALTYQGDELSGDGYARALIQFGQATSLVDGTSEVKNEGWVTFPTPTSTWYADGFRIYDAQSGGNLLFEGDFDASIEVTSSEVLVIDHERVRLSLGLDHWTTEAQEKALDVAFAGGSYQPAGLYVALLKSEPDFDTKAADLDELSGAGYAREQVTPWSFTGGTASNDQKTTFDPATADWDPFAASALVDAQQGGVVIGWDTNSPIEVLNGDDVEINAGGATLTF